MRDGIMRTIGADRWCLSNAAGNWAHHYVLPAGSLSGTCKGCGHSRTWEAVDYATE